MLLHADLDQVKLSVKEVEGGSSTWSNKVVALRSTVMELKDEVHQLRRKCEDMEGHMRRCNVRIIGVPEAPESSSATAVANLLTEVLQLDKAPLTDRSHRTPGGKKSGNKPRVIVAELHNSQERVEMLRRARSCSTLLSKVAPIASDHAASAATAQAFMEVRRLLRHRRDVCYGRFSQIPVTYGEEKKPWLTLRRISSQR